MGFALSPPGGIPDAPIGGAPGMGGFIAAGGATGGGTGGLGAPASNLMPSSLSKFKTPGAGAGFKAVGTTFGGAAAGGTPGIGGFGTGGGIMPGAPTGGIAGLGTAGIPGIPVGGTTGGVTGLGAEMGGAEDGAAGAAGFLSSKASNIPLVAEGGFRPEGAAGVGAAGADIEAKPGMGIGGLGATGAPSEGAAVGGAATGGFRAGAGTGGTFPANKASKTPGPPGTAGFGITGGVKPGTPKEGGAAGLGIPGTPSAGGGGGIGLAVPGIAIPGTAGFGIPGRVPRVGVTPGFKPGAVTEGEAEIMGGGASPGFLIFVGNVKMSLVPGSAFSATAPPPWAARIVLTRANLSPVPANWGEAGCLGS